jgi:hypothetical protein
VSPRSIVRGAVLLAALLQVGIATGQSLPQKIDVSKLGPQIGQQAADFALKDQNGNSRNLASIMGPKGALLVFFRSADW